MESFIDNHPHFLVNFFFLFSNENGPSIFSFQNDIENNDHKKNQPKHEATNEWSVAFSNKREQMAKLFADASVIFHETGPIDERIVRKFLVK